MYKLTKTQRKMVKMQARMKTSQAVLKQEKIEKGSAFILNFIKRSA